MLTNNFKSLAALIMFGKFSLLNFDTENIYARNIDLNLWIV